MSNPESLSDQEQEDFEWEDEVNYEYLDEENNILGLIECELPFQDFFNTYYWANDFYQRTIDPHQLPYATYIAESLEVMPKHKEEYLWDTGRNAMGTTEITQLEQEFNKVGSRWYPIPLEKNYYFPNPLEIFLDYVNSGRYPVV